MLQNYFKIAFRSLFKQKGYSLINIAGLSISIAVTLLMLLWIQDEWNTDKFHANGDRLFYLKRTIPLDNGKLDIYNGVPYPVLKAAKEELPEVEKLIPIGGPFEGTLKVKNQTLRAKGNFANLDYFESFSFPVLEGDIRQLEERIDAIALSESLAHRFFGNIWRSTALGATISIGDLGDFSVAAVYKDFPTNSSIQSDFYYPLSKKLKDSDWMLEWGNSGMQGALLLADGAKPSEVAQKIENIYQTHQEGALKEGCIVHKFGDNYLYGQFDEQAKVVGGRIEYVRMFGLAALLLLIISCINFVNLATARASERAKEVGVRKSIGAGRKSLIAQFMLEAAVITIFSVGIAILLAEIALPNVRLITEKMLDFDYTQFAFWACIFLIIIVTTLLSGIYPAFVLSAYRPINVLKGNLKTTSGSISFRKSLVIVQFILALILIAGSFVIKEQVHFIQNKNLGLNKDNLLVLEKEEQIGEKYDVLKDKLLKSKGIEKVTLAGPTPIAINASTGGVSWEGKKKEDGHIEFAMLWAESNFLDVFDISLLAGRFYKEGAKQDTNSIVLNEKAIEIMGFTDDPIGKTIQWWGKPRQIIGVIGDFHNLSLYEPIQPAGILLDPDNAWSMFVKTKAGETSEAITSLQNVFSEVVPDAYLHYEFVDDQYQAEYTSEVLTGILADYFAVISIFIAALGLLGLSTFLAAQRTKEIGIRKVLGASISNLIALMSKDFLLLVGAGLLIGLPIAWYLLTKWLGNFAYTVELQWWMFAIPIFIALVIAGFTVGIQAFRAAIHNPIDALKKEA